MIIQNLLPNKAKSYMIYSGVDLFLASFFHQMLFFKKHCIGF